MIQVPDEFQRVCRLNELSENIGKRFIVDDMDVAVYKFKENVYAMSNICPHQHSALIYDGYISDNCVVCPVHGWMFDLNTGRTPSGGGKLQMFETTVINDDVFVKIKKKDFNW